MSKNNTERLIYLFEVIYLLFIFCLSSIVASNYIYGFTLVFSVGSIINLVEKKLMNCLIALFASINFYTLLDKKLYLLPFILLSVLGFFIFKEIIKNIKK